MGDFRLEFMGNSDNVLRLGLTTKHIDVASMLKALDFSSSGFTVETAFSGYVTHSFEPLTPECALSSIPRPHLSPAGQQTFPATAPRVLVCLSGQITVQTTADNDEPLSRGQALFVPATETAIPASGCGSLAQAFVPGNRGILPRRFPSSPDLRTCFFDRFSGYTPVPGSAPVRVES